MGWLIDPDEQSVFVYTPNQQLEVFENPEDRLLVPPFASELRLTVESLFAWLRE